MLSSVGMRGSSGSYGSFSQLKGFVVERTEEFVLKEVRLCQAR